MIKKVLDHIYPQLQSKESVASVRKNSALKSSDNRINWRRNTCFLFFFVFILSIVSCKKLIEVDAPGNNLNAANVYSNDATAIAVLTGVYAKMSNLQVSLKNNSITSVSLFAALSADEMTLFNLNDGVLANYYQNNLSATATATFLWNIAYDHIYTVNGVIEGLNASNALTPAVKQHLLGEAKFLRAFCYFYLTNFYGNIPMILSSDWKSNASASSISQADIYKQIIQDLKDAKDLLSENYLTSDLLTSTQERIRPNKWAAGALLARTYLYTKDWANAEIEATAVINNASIYDTVSLNKGIFIKNSKETIWALQPVQSGTGSNTGDGSMYILPSTGPNTSTYPVYLSSNILKSFESGDLRKSTWIDSVKSGNTAYYYAKKYQIGKISTATQEYQIVLRLAEMYLLRGEARAQQNNLNGSITDLDLIRKRAGLPLFANTNLNPNQTTLLTAILHERQVELFTEWGHRWFDLKRTNTIDAVMTSVAPLKGGTWGSYKALFPIPYSEIKLNPNISQNSGY